MGVRLLGRAMLGQLVVVAINYDSVRTVKSYDSALYAKWLDPDRKITELGNFLVRVEPIWHTGLSRTT